MTNFLGYIFSFGIGATFAVWVIKLTWVVRKAEIIKKIADEEVKRELRKRGIEE